MTLSPEQRAQQVFDKIIEGDSYDKHGNADVPALIAAAIREAENETLERAADIVERVAKAQSEGWRERPKEDGCGGAIAASNTGFLAAQAIREKKG